MSEQGEIKFIDYKSFNTKNNIDLDSNLKQRFNDHATNLVASKFDGFQKHIPGWSFSKNCSLEENLNKFDNTSGVTSYIALTPEIPLKTPVFISEIQKLRVLHELLQYFYIPLKFMLIGHLPITIIKTFRILMI